MFDNFRNMDLKYKILVLASSTIAIIIMLSVLVTVISNILAPNNNPSSPDNQTVPSQSVAPSNEPEVPTNSSPTISEVPAYDNTVDSDEMGIIYDVPLTSDEQVKLLQFAKNAYSELCKLETGETYNQHFESVKSLFMEPDDYRNKIELYVKPADTQTCMQTSHNIFGYDELTGRYQVVVSGYRTREYNGNSSESKLVINMAIIFDSDKNMKINAIL
jgi:hypothetical protein